MTQQLNEHNVTKNDELTPRQSRMARAALSLGVRDLANLAEMSPNTITRFERGEDLQPRTIKGIKRALEKKGAEFIRGGVRVK